MPITLVQPDSGKVTVRVVNSQRNKEGKLEYKQIGSFDVAGASAAEVLNFLKTAVARNSQTK